MDAWKREHSDFPTLKSGSNKSGWVAALCFLFRPPMGQAGLRTLSACRLPGGHTGRDTHPSASWLPLVAALVTVLGEFFWWVVSCLFQNLGQVDILGELLHTQDDPPLSLTIPRSFPASLCQSPGPASKLLSSSLLAVTRDRRSTTFRPTWATYPRQSQKG